MSWWDEMALELGNSCVTYLPLGPLETGENCCRLCPWRSCIPLFIDSCSVPLAATHRLFLNTVLVTTCMDGFFSLFFHCSHCCDEFCGMPRFGWFSCSMLRQEWWKHPLSMKHLTMNMPRFSTEFPPPTRVRSMFLFVVYVPLQFAFGAVQLVSYRTKPACRRCFSFSLRCTFTYRFGRVMCLYTLYKTYNI